jgi:hypothetical protein
MIVHNIVLLHLFGYHGIFWAINFVTYLLNTAAHLHLLRVRFFNYSIDKSLVL